ncbi:M48 family metalloprotease [Tsuneonella suprasediminis]|uniref:M48 family metalloprotease n=1 Tax=Tsuneonella suprasediminis TaxID=2306996 RepID=UPI002F93BC2C
MSFRSIRSRTAVAAASLSALALSGCATMGGPIPSASTPITQTEAQQGAEANKEIIQQFGAAMSGPQAQYVEGVGQRIAVQSGLATSPSAFKVAMLNSSVNNAFAIPGGYVYTTRQLVTLMNNEAELAAVLGHEVGHVAARHSQRRQQAAQQNALLGLLGQVVGSVVGGGVGDLISQGSQYTQLLTLKFSRSQELEADALGQKYLVSAGYDPHAMATLLTSLAAQNALDSQLQGRGNATVPEWASTHPDPASRVSAAMQRAGAATGRTERDLFLTRVDGLMYGDDPQQGVIEGSSFIQPTMRLKFTAPGGFYMVNGTQAVSINGQSGQAQFTLAPYSGNLETYVRQAFSGLSNQQQISPSQIQRTTVNGIPAAYGTARVQSSSGAVDVTVFAYEFANNRAYHFVAITKAGGAGVFNSMYQSVRRLSASEAGSVIPRRIDVVTVGSRDTVRSLAARMAYTNAQEQRFRVLNGLSSSDRITPGQKVKIVARGS